MNNFHIFLIIFLILFYFFLKILLSKFKNSKRKIFVQKELRKIDSMTGLEFEKYIAKVLLKNKYKKINITKSSGDFGVDIIAFNKYNTKIAIQCKRYKNKVNLKAVQEVVSGMKFYNCKKSIVITNNYFNKSAILLAKKTKTQLWDRNYLKKII